MNSKYLLAILATAFVMVLLFSKDKKIKTKASAEIELTGDSEQKKILPEAKLASASSADNKPAVAVSSIEKPVLNENIQKKFAFHLKALGKCLKLTDQNVAEKTDPTVENLMSLLRSSIGDMVVQMDDWSQTEFVDQGSVRKRVRVDFDYPDGSSAVRRLSMYQINSYGMPEIVNLTADEVNNPNEAYVASLSEGNKILVEEKGSRAYFTDGEELIFSVRNGQLQSLSINKSDRSFNCFNLDEETSSCTCP